MQRPVWIRTAAPAVNPMPRRAMARPSKRETIVHNLIEQREPNYWDLLHGQAQVIGLTPKLRQHELKPNPNLPQAQTAARRIGFRRPNRSNQSRNQSRNQSYPKQKFRRIRAKLISTIQRDRAVLPLPGGLHGHGHTIHKISVVQFSQHVAVIADRV